MTKKIIAVDLDGTLLNSDSQISDFTKETIKKVAEKGHQVIITTGRPYRMSKDFYRELGLDTPMINFNGSLTHLPDQVWNFEKCLTVDKKYLLDMVQRSEDIQADFIAGEYRKKILHYKSQWRNCQSQTIWRRSFPAWRSISAWIGDQEP